MATTPAPQTAPMTDPAANYRSDPLYIGPTNWSNLQKQYTPYQLEQATERRDGGIFFKSGVDITSVPKSAPATPLPAPVVKPMDSAALTAPSVPVTTGSSAVTPRQELDTRNAAAATYLSGIDKTLDDQMRMREELVKKQQEEQKKTTNSLIDRLKGTLDQTTYQDSLKRDRELFQTETMIRQLGDIRSRIADATNALTQGILYEESRPVRMVTLIGRSAELKKQGEAHLQALQSTAEIIKGNIDLARAYADDSIAAIKADNAEKRSALNTLLELENNKLISLEKEEKDIIASRQKLLTEEADRVEKERDAIFNLATEYPDAFVKGGVTYLDTQDKALAKMTPYLAESDRLKIEQARASLELTKSQILENKAQASKALSGDSGGSSGVNSTEESVMTSARDAVKLALQRKKEGAAGWQDITVDEIIQNVLAQYGPHVRDQAQLKLVVENAAGKKANMSDADLLRELQFKEAAQKAENLRRGLVDRSGDTTAQARAIRQAIGNGLVRFNEANNTYEVISDKVKNYSKGHGIDPQDIVTLEKSGGKWIIKSE